MCPNEGYYDVQSLSCGTMFLKCFKDNNEIQAYMYQCPEGYAFWSTSRRCERNFNILQCKDMDVSNSRWEIPIETANLSFKRNVK